VPEEDPDEDDRRPSGPPLPPDDRLWRHPSELAALAPRPSGEAVEAGRRAWPVAVLGVVAGAALATSAIAISGALSPRVVERAVIEKVAVSPVVASPLLGGDEELADLVDRVAPAVVRIEATREDEQVAASGVVFRDDGLVLTAAHPLQGASTVVVVLPDGRRLEAQVVGTDELTDVAVVAVDADHLPVAVLGDASAALGELVVALGAMDGAPGQPVLSAGVVTGLQRWVRLHDGPTLHGLVETDATVRGDQEGGPLVDATGTVVGITTASGDDGSAHGYAVPVGLAHHVALRLLEQGEVTHAWLGVEAVDLDDDERDELGLGGGALVRAVMDGGPADLAGVEAGDVITHVDGTPIGSASALVVALRLCEPGDAVVLRLHRDGAAHDSTAVVAPRPEG
jgi:S1-C subfamily serine protease